MDARETYLDDRPVSTFLGPENPEGEPAKPAEEDERTMLDVGSIDGALRAGRNCTLCLEERTDTCSTECGHLFCWSCIVGWGREKVRLEPISKSDGSNVATGGVPTVPTVLEPNALVTNL